jgi:hypothetical protein
VNSPSLTEPRLDGPVDSLFNQLAHNAHPAIEDIWEAARLLLRVNYDLSDEEVAILLSVAPGQECHDLMNSVLDVLFGPEEGERSYTDWIRASLLANGLTLVEIRANDLPNVMALLVATNRTVPIDMFVDTCRAASSCRALEALI